MKSSVYVLIFLVVILDTIPQWTSSSRLIRVLRSPDTASESHISNFLHQHRADSRADKPELKPDNSTDPKHRRPSKPKTTTTEPPISQTELLVNLIHNTIVTVREQFPALIGAISSPSNPPTTTKHPKKVHHAVHKTHAHVVQERSANATSEEEKEEVTESSETSAGSRETSAGSGENSEEELDDEVRDGEEGEENPEEFPQNNNPIAFIPPALIRTIVEASGSSAARGSAGASAGSAASLVAGASSSISSGSGRSARQAEGESQGSGSGEFLFSIITSKIRGLTSLFLSPLYSASRFFQRSIGTVTSGSSGVNPEPDPRHRNADEHGHHHSHDDHHNHHHGSDHHYSNHHHEHRSGDHHSDSHDHHSHNHSGDHDHHSGDHNQDHHHNSTPVDESANLILGNDEMQDTGRKYYYRNVLFNATDINSSSEVFQSNETIANEISSDESTGFDGPLKIVLVKAGRNADDAGNNIQRRIID